MNVFKKAVKIVFLNPAYGRPEASLRVRLGADEQCRAGAPWI